jgi:Ca-activated chloride channel homolog
MPEISQLYELNQITFQYPYAFLLILVYFVCIRFCKQKYQSLYFSNTKLLKSVTKNQSLLVKILRFLIMIFIVISLASPVKKDDIVINNNKGYEISLILDASGSMIEANKFTITKEIVSDFIKQRKQDRLGLSIFADFAYVAVPLTYDKKSLLGLLKHIEVGIAGKRQTALYEALFLSSKLFEKSKSKNKIAILLTDGLNNVDTIPLDIAIGKAKKYGIKVYTVGIGHVGDFNPLVLKQISKETNGKFFQAESFKKLKDIYDTINRLEKSDIKAKSFVKIEYFYQYSLYLAIWLLFLLILINRRYR